MALYKKLSDPALKSSSKHAMFLNLLYKSLIKDISERRVKVCLSLKSPPKPCSVVDDIFTTLQCNSFAQLFLLY